MNVKNIYAELRNEGKYAFVPAERQGRWIRTHICAAFVACPNCEAKRRRPCRTSDGNMTVKTCLDRRAAYKKQVIADAKKVLNGRGSKS